MGRGCVCWVKWLTPHPGAGGDGGDSPRAACPPQDGAAAGRLARRREEDVLYPCLPHRLAVGSR